MASQCRYRKGNSQQESGGCSEGGDDLNGRSLRSRSSRASFPMDLFLTAVLLACLTFCGFSIPLDQEIEQLSPKDHNPTARFQKTHFFLFLFPQLSSALLFDAVYAVVSAVQELNRSQEIGVKPLSCGSAQIWQHGTSLMNYLRMVRAVS